MSNFFIVSYFSYNLTMARQTPREPTQYDVWRDIVRKAKQEHIIFIAYFFELAVITVSFGVLVQNLTGMWLFYGIVYSIGYLGAIFTPGLLIWKSVSAGKL